MKALLTLLFVAACVALGTWWRIDTALAVKSFDTQDPVGLLKSDPALLYHFTQRIADNGGRIPDDFAASRDVQWPDVVDLRVEFPMGQPWLAANLWLVTGKRQPLHVFCVELFALLAASTGIAVFGLARELSGRRLLAGAALLTWSLLPGSYRTLGFVLLGEDLSFPFFAFHLWLVARAARVRTPISFLLAGATLVGAFATWHAAGFFVAMEIAVLLAWYLRSGENPFACRHAWLVPATLAVACFVDPMLRGKLQILSLPMQLAGTLLVLAAIERRRRLRPWARVGVAAATLCALLGAGIVVSRQFGAGLGDYSHVFRLLLAKLEHLGRRPADPDVLPFEVRILWQGPFNTASATELCANLDASLFGLVGILLVGLGCWRRGGKADAPSGSGAPAVLALLCLAALVASWLIVRTQILAAFLFPVAGAVALARLSRWIGHVIAAVAVLIAAELFPMFAKYMGEMRWYEPNQRREIAALVRAIDELVPPGAAVASDEVTSTPILAHTGHPILVQPKYEWAAARARLEEFRMAALRGRPEDLAAVLRARDCRYLAFDWQVLWGTRYQAGLPDSVTEPEHGSVLYMIAATPDQVPGFKLLWKSPLPSNRTRLYELVD